MKKFAKRYKGKGVERTSVAKVMRIRGFCVGVGEKRLFCRRTNGIESKTQVKEKPGRGLREGRRRGKV